MTWVALILTTLTIGEEKNMPLPPIPAGKIAAIVAGYERPWMPESGELSAVLPPRDLHVGLTALGGGTVQAETRLNDDLGLLTAAYLFHMVGKAGGTAHMARADDRPEVNPEAPRDDAQAEDVCADLPCLIHLRISYAPAASGAAGGCMVSAGLDSAGSGLALADHLRAALQAGGRGSAVAGGSQGARQEGTRPPAECLLQFSYPGGDAEIRRFPGATAARNAAAVYRGLAAYLQSQTPAGDRSPDNSGSDGSDVANGESSPFLAVAAMKNGLRRQGRSLWPQGPLPAERVDWFCDAFVRQVVTNRSLVLLQTDARVTDDGLVFSGMTNTPTVAAGLEYVLSTLEVGPIRNELRLLPDLQRLGGRRFGACRVAMALTFNAPHATAGRQTQVLFGEPLFLLDRDRGYYLVQAADGYWGWLREDAVQVLDDAEFRSYSAGPWGTALEDVQTDGVYLPRGSRVVLARTDTLDMLEVVCPGGRRVAVAGRAVRPDQDPGPAAAQRVEAALGLLHTPYVFGGRSPLGLDCSGLVNSVLLRTTGRMAARDAWQQAFAGTLVATHWYREGMQAGDVVSFIDATGKIYHTGIALDGTHVVHAAPPAVQIGSIKPGDRLYDLRLDRDFFLVKRP